MTAPRNVRIVIEEMLDHLEYVLAKAQNLSPTEFRADRDIRQSVERSLEIISEASRLLPAALKETKPEISWRKVADFGNVLRHAYFGVNSDIVLRIAKDDLVPLRDALLSMRHNLDC
jgi:uncharacterized protein with HEPN domain